MEDQIDLHLESDKSLGRVSARAVLNSMQGSHQPARSLPHVNPNSSDSTLTSPARSLTSSPNSVRAADSHPDSPRVLPLPPSRKKHMETAGRTSDNTSSTVSGQDKVPLRGDKTPDSLPDDLSSFASYANSENIVNSPPFSSLSVKINVDDSPPLDSNVSAPNDIAHKKVERTNQVPDLHVTDHMYDVVKPDIKLVTPSPTDEHPDEQGVNTKGKREDKIPLTKISSSIRSSIRSKFGVCDKPADGGEGGEKEPVKQKLSGKPSSRLSVEHQLLGVSSSTISNSGTDQHDVDMITVNEAVLKAGLGRYHVLPFFAAAMVIVLKCFVDGVPDNFVTMFQCV